MPSSFAWLDYSEELRVGVGPDGASLYRWIYVNGFASWLVPINASLAFAVAGVFVLWIVAWGMDRQGVYVRV